MALQDASRELRLVNGMLYRWNGEKWVVHTGSITFAEAEALGLSPEEALTYSDVHGEIPGRPIVTSPVTEIPVTDTVTEGGDMSERDWWDIGGEEGFDWEDIMAWGGRGVDLLAMGGEAVGQWMREGGESPDADNPMMVNLPPDYSGQASPSGEKRRKRVRQLPVITCQDQEDVDFVLLTLPKAWHKDAIGVLLSGRM